MEDPPLRHGYLLTPPQGKLLKRTWQRKYYALYRASNYAVERVEVFDNEEGYLQLATSKRIIPLNDCVKVVQVPQKNQQNVFEVRTKKQVYQFSSETTQELAEWVTAFQMVAFGGRRDLISPLPLSTTGISSSTPPPPYTTPSLSGVIKAEEEENQIYSSCSFPDVHFIQIVDTEASVACGLRGNYLLVVSPLQLLLYEDGANTPISKREPLFVWPYRHIRRYGRNKDVFTFEAGRKCSSGEGTFTFATPEANIIFLRVQTNTRTLKREGEDVASFTPSVLLNKPIFPPPWSMETIDHRSKVDLSEDSFSHSRKLSQDSSNRPKIAPPFAKPPRKGKIPSVSDEKTSPTEPIRLGISTAARAMLAAEAMMNSSARHGMPVLTPPPSTTTHSLAEPTYAVPEFRKDAWKMFGLETDHIHEENVPVAPDAYYASVQLSPSVTSVQFPPAPKKDQVNRILPSQKKTPDNNDDYCYDHLVQFGNVQSTKSNASAAELPPDGHIYSRLNSVTSQPEQSSVSPTPALANYEEINSLSEMTMTIAESTNTSADNNGVAEREDIKRFFQNDDVYTVVLKKSVKHSVHPSSDET
ncbi:hypothetical protein CHUAL_012703 [Chamberlinius hualienensis]